MARDYARSNYRSTNTKRRREAPKKQRKRIQKTSRHQQQKKTSFSRGWVVMGLLLGTFGGGLFYLNHHRHHPQGQQITAAIDAKQSGAAPSVTTENKAARAKLKPAAVQTKYDFYTILPATKTVAQPSEATNETSKNTASTPTTTKTSETAALETDHYVLQIVSVKNFKDADRLKAELSLMGFKVFSSTYSKNGTEWYRVNVGPFQELNLAEDEQDKLRENNINSLLIHIHPDRSDHA